ncbi:MAG: DUF6600 domain-containing protein [Acidobacteriota bacterium]
MRKGAFAAILFAGLMLIGSPRPAEGSVHVSLSFFHETLAPHGRWVVTTSYGEVWAPAVAVGWEPYVYGEWLYTDYGWSWVSDDPWGDIPFHYGTWTWVDPYGWVWVPGLVWAPAWVTWAYTDDCIGWAPVPPSFVLSGGGYFGRPIVVSQTRYVFVPARRFVGTPIETVRLSSRRNAELLGRATRVTRYDVSRGIVRNLGPAPARIERSVGRRIERVPAERARIQPAKLADSGIRSARHLPVVAPARERAHAARAAKPERPVTRRAAAEHRPSPAEHRPSPSERKAAVNRHPAPPAHRVATQDQKGKKHVASQPQSAARKREDRAPETARRPAPRATAPERIAHHSVSVAHKAPPSAREHRVSARPAHPPKAKPEARQGPSVAQRQLHRPTPRRPDGRQTMNKRPDKEKPGNQGGSS